MGANIRKDLFGFIDIVAMKLGEDGLLGVQATSDNGGNVSARMQKTLESEHYPLWLATGNRFEIHGWKKSGARDTRKLWNVRIVDSNKILSKEILHPNLLQSG